VTRAPFTGIRVVEISGGIAVSYAGKLFADAGAEVVKLEPAAGDPVRRWTASGIHLLTGENSALFEFLNTNKRSLVGAVDDHACEQLLENADVVLVGSHGAADLRERFPSLVVVSISRPYADGPSPNEQDRSGEWIAGAYAAVTAAAAIRGGRSSSRGTQIDVWADPAATASTGTKIDRTAAGRTLIQNPAGFQQPPVPYRIGEFYGMPLKPAPRPGDGIAAWSLRSVRERPPAGPHLPLQGIRVLDLTANLAGPSATLVLAALGADVLKVEGLRRPDDLRLCLGCSDTFRATNQNKRGLAIDLDVPVGRRLAHQLAAKCDVVLEDFPQRALGLAPEVLHAKSPQTVLVRLSAAGLEGPGDPIGGLHAAFGTLVALEQRDRTGRGELVEVSMLAAALNVIAERIVERTAYGTIPATTGNPVASGIPGDGLPLRFEGGPYGWPSRPAPALGEHNRQVLTALLGMTTVQLQELEDAGVIGPPALVNAEALTDQPKTGYQTPNGSPL
jgi:crotonobetainyl-CoA:carnitine CoA-transferase CaiB-like acyl-CoA transferase